MSTLTSARREVSRAVAGLRVLGCRVSMTVGHDLAAGEARYVVRLPCGVEISPDIEPRYGVGRVALRAGRVVVMTERATSYAGLGADQTWRDDVKLRLLEAASLLDALADRIGEVDRESSASSQHYIDTGRYLTHAEVEEVER